MRWKKADRKSKRNRWCSIKKERSIQKVNDGQRERERMNERWK